MSVLIDGAFRDGSVVAIARDATVSIAAMIAWPHTAPLENLRLAHHFEEKVRTLSLG